MALIIGNIIALIASILMVYSGYIKQKNKILLVQTIQIGMSVVSNVILGGISGAIINTIGCVRNILCYKNKLNTIAKAIIIILSVILIVAFNNIGIIGYLPLISTIVYVMFMNEKDVLRFKGLIIFTMIMWLIYDLAIKSYTSAVFNFGNIVANLISIAQLKKKKIKSGEKNVLYLYDKMFR